MARATTRTWSLRIAALCATLGVAHAASALKERTEEGFPLTFNVSKIELGDQLELRGGRTVFFEVTNPTDETIEYFMKSSSRNAKVDLKTIEIAPGETQRIEVELEYRVAGPFRHRIGVIVEPTRGALLIEGSVVYEPD